jgi:hypothetical protein
MTVKEAALAAGVTRQWLNVRVNRGEVPGVTRGPNGRLLIQSDDELRRWASQNQKLLSGQRGRRLMAEQRSRLRSAAGNYLTVGELADRCDCAPETIRAKAAKIPGVFMGPRGVRYSFEVSEKLSMWIEREVARSLLRRKHGRRLSEYDEPKPPGTFLRPLLRVLADYKFGALEGEETLDLIDPDELILLNRTLEPFLRRIQRRLKKRLSRPSVANVRRAGAHKSS